MARTTAYKKTEWDTMHNNGPFPLKCLYVTELEPQGNIPDAIDRLNDAADEIRRLIKETIDAGQGFRAYGSRWSLSNIAHHKDRMHFNANMNLHVPLKADDIHPQGIYKDENLFFFQCGNTIKELSKTLNNYGKSLKSSGASNGQTIAGCISTGVHGAAIDAGAIPDYVVGLNLIIGPELQDVVYIERHTKPALSDAFAHKIRARTIRNDALFNAALVGLGSFGFIHGIVIEAEDRYLLRRYVKKVDKDIALHLSDTMDFENSDFKIDGETDSKGKPLRPYHFKVFMNPYADDREYVIEIMYKKPYAIPYPDPLPTIKTSLYRDLIHLLIKVSEKWPKKIPYFVRKLQKAVLPPVDMDVTGTLAEIFWDAPYLGPAFACSVGVDHTHSSKALKLLANLAKEEGPIPGIYAMRFVRQTEATLGFTKFPLSCIIEIDGVLWNKSKKLMSLTDFSRRMIEVLQQAGVPFTVHWGKNMDWGYPGLIDHMYGQKAKEWRQYRSALLSNEMAEFFCNDFLKTAGLAEIVEDIPNGLIDQL
ncbi:hypothetical protein SAMN06265379_101338 [Saccharicrinis carchari]|uniref:FAD binding domain-containing protein n=1 Tax=Saccharicrinis carchari TaxID=1168039 RepID=A0A521ARE4_SACCC|nr:FAD-linked oxidase [Saccharicrinis carchari]SMO37345.1 hypothetical protein SAMN06265379_101338 [Saccharicrinis carchari]